MSNEDRIQALMDEVYTEWQKEENKDKSKHKILEDFSLAHNIAVVFGNFNYQVGNGGIAQWIYNGYCQDDIEKFVEYLKKGVSLDKDRFEYILKTMKKLDDPTDYDRYGNNRETCDYCGGYGYVKNRYAEDDEDSEEECGECDGNGYVEVFLGDSIDCDEFDTWYYDNCGNDEWWEAVCNLIDNYKSLEDGKVSFKPTCRLIGVDSNIFNLLGVASSTLKKAGLKNEAKEMFGRAMSSGSFSEALGIIQDYVRVV